MKTPAAILPVLLCGCLLAGPLQAQGGNGDDWSEDSWLELGAPAPVIASLRFGASEGDDQWLAADLSLPLSERARLGLSWSRNRIDTAHGRFDSNDLEGRLDWQLDPAFSLLAAWRFQGQKQELEIEQYRLGLGWNAANWHAALSFGSGRVSVYPRDDLPPRLDIGPRSTDLSLWRLELGYQGDNLGGFASLEQLRYDDDLSALGRLSLLRYVVAPGALINSDLLLQRQLALGLYGQHQAWGWTLQWTDSRDEVDELQTRSLLLDLRRPLAGHSDLLLGLGHTLDSDQPWSLSIGLEWTGS
jgi:hypothetical protein